MSRLVKILSMVLVLSILFLTLSVGVSASVPIEDDEVWDTITDDDVLTLLQGIEEMEAYLLEKETGVNQLLDQASGFVADDETIDPDMAYEFTVALNALQSEYQLFVEERDVDGCNSIIIFRHSYIIRACRTAVAGALAYFFFHGFMLSFEMLLFSYINISPWATYTPYYSYIIRETDLFHEIVTCPELSTEPYVFPFPEKDRFAEENRIATDLSLAIHGFSCTRTETYPIVVTITDRYDFEWRGVDLSSWEVAVNDVFFIIQILGVIVPYNVSISLED